MFSFPSVGLLVVFSPLRDPHLVADDGRFGFGREAVEEQAAVLVATLRGDLRDQRAGGEARVNRTIKVSA